MWPELRSTLSFLGLIPGLLLPGALRAQSDIEIRLLEPVGFIAPGEIEQIVVEIVNPPASGLTVSRVSGGGHGSRPPVIGEQLRASRDWGRLQSGMSRSAACRLDECVLRGQFPLRPGESLEYQAFAVAVPAGTPVGTEIANSRINLKLNFEGDHNGQLEYYTDKDLVRLVTADGNGDYSVFDGLDLTSPTAGRLQPALALQFDYVDEVDAGDAFDIYATLTNNDSGPVTFNNLYGGRVVFGFGRVTGEHARSFRFVPCMEECLPVPSDSAILSGAHRLEPGESLTYLMGTYFYENDALFDGQLILSDLQLLVQDHTGRSGRVPVPSEPIVVEVRNTAASSALASRAYELTLPLENYDLLTEGDRLLIYDPNTGLEWLRLTAAAGYEVEEMLAETRPGGKFADFQLASVQQIEALVLNHVNGNGGRLGAYALYSPMSSDQNRHWQSLVQLLGPMPFNNRGMGVIGFVSDPPDPSVPIPGARTLIEITAPEVMSPGGAIVFSSPSRMQKHFLNAARQTVYDYTGVWLVREPLIN